MFLKELVDLNRVCFHQRFDDWEEAVGVKYTAICFMKVEELLALDEKYGG